MRAYLILPLALCLFLIGCGDDSDGNNSFVGGGTQTSSDTSSGESTADVKAGLSCGVVVNSEFKDSVSADEGEEVTLVSVHDSNLVEVDNGTGPKLVKLHALGSTLSFQNTAAVGLLTGLGAERLFYFKAGECVTGVTGGGSAEIGQIITESGTSFSESVIRNHVGGAIEQTGDCNEAALASCYNGISKETVDTGVAEPEEEEAEEEEEPSSDVPAETKRLTVSDFLWKPESESGYNPGGLSILTNPCNVKVVVNGNELRDYPSGNGRCVTVRAAQSGCEFGSNIKVEVIDRETGTPALFGSATFITIANGCDRVEFEGVESNNGGAGTVGEPEIFTSGSPGSGGDGEDSNPTGGSCQEAPAIVKYRASHSECDGNAAVILSGNLSNAFSVQLRKADGSDRLDENCAEPNCTPYKVQKYIDLPGQKVACFGAPGSSNVMAPITLTTVKLTSDDSTPEKFCIPDPAQDVN